MNHSLHSFLALAFHNIGSIYPNRAMSNSVSVQFSPVAFGVSFSFWFRFRFHFFNLFSSSIHILVDVVFSSIRHEKREKKSRPLHRMLNFFFGSHATKILCMQYNLTVVELAILLSQRYLYSCRLKSAKIKKPVKNSTCSVWLNVFAKRTLLHKKREMPVIFSSCCYLWLHFVSWAFAN